jgi:hypothetical protein
MTIDNNYLTTTHHQSYGNPLSSHRWPVKVAKPMYIFGPDKHAKLIHLSPTIVSTRIDEFLRDNSIQATFDADNAEANCKTADGLHYKITLYSPPHSNHDDDNGVDKDYTNNATYVEVIKTNKGCGFQFLTHRQNIINVARGSEIDQPTCHNHNNRENISRNRKTKRTTREIMKIPADLLTSYEPPSISDLQDTLYTATDQLHSSNQQVILFTLQNLLSITTPDATYPNTALEMSRLIMQNFSNVRDMIGLIYTNAVQSYDSVINDTNERLCNACLSILINSMTLLEGNHNEPLFNNQNQGQYFLGQLIPSLAQSVRNHRKDTHNAHLAIVYLDKLTKCVPATCKNLLTDIGIDTLLEEARLYGHREHLKLEMAASHMLERLQGRGSVAV